MTELFSKINHMKNSNENVCQMDSYSTNIKWKVTKYEPDITYLEFKIK